MFCKVGTRDHQSASLAVTRHLASSRQRCRPPLRRGSTLEATSTAGRHPALLMPAPPTLCMIRLPACSGGTSEHGWGTSFTCRPGARQTSWFSCMPPFLLVLPSADFLLYPCLIDNLHCYKLFLLCLLTLQAAAQSQASSAHAMRRFTRCECQADPDISVATSLHPPLTLPRQLPEELPSMERPAERQPAQPNGEAELQVQQNGRPEQPSLAGTAATPPAGKAEATALAAEVPRAKPTVQQQSMDLYADLGSSAPSPAAPTVSARLPPAGHGRDTVALVQQADNRAGQCHLPPGPLQAPAQMDAARHVQPQPSAMQQQQERQRQQQQEQQQQERQQLLEAAPAGSLQALLSNPAALQALLKDPAQLQRLLEKHPALISMLRTTLSQKP